MEKKPISPLELFDLLLQQMNKELQELHKHQTDMIGKLTTIKDCLQYQTLNKRQTKTVDLRSLEKQTNTLYINKKI